MEPARASPSCPRCGAESPAAARCPRCGFAFLEAAERRRLPRPLGRVVALSAAGAAAAAAVVLIAGRDAPQSPPDPVSADEAERRLELRFGAAIRCPGSIDADRIIRCVLRYDDGVARALLVRLSPRGDIEADVPYPATLRR